LARGPTSKLLFEVDAYIERLCVPRDQVLEAALRDAAAAGLPDIHVSPNEGKLLYLLARLSGAKRILEIGLLGGYSTIWLARALPKGGRLVTLEIDEHFARVARKNLRRAGVLSKVEIRIAPALGTLKKMVRAKEKSFDLVFIDADKVSYPVYLDWALKLVRPGSLILADNVIRGGAVAQSAARAADVKAMRAFNRKLARHPRLETILLPIMRRRLDGLAIARVKDS
jgi:caffeoyl-CoA O-methyltransferase